MSEDPSPEYRGAHPPSDEWWPLAGPAYTLDADKTAAMFAAGARIVGPFGVDHNAMEHLLGTDSRNPPAKHRILELYLAHGLELPDTPIVALHRGRIDLLEEHLARDPRLLTRTFAAHEIYVHAPACFREPLRVQGTPIHHTTLLHIAAYFDEVEIAEWLLDRGMDPNVRSAVDADDFGGYTALFNAVVSQRGFWVNYGRGQPDEARFAKLLLARGADPSIRASMKSGFEQGHGGGDLVEYRNVTALEYAEQVPKQIFVSREAVRAVRALG